MAMTSQSFKLLFGVVFFFFSTTPSLLQAQEPTAYAPKQWTNDISLNNVRYPQATEKNIIYPNGYVRSILLLNNHGTSNPSVACGFICADPCDVFLFAIFFVEIGSGGASHLVNPLTIWSANQENPVGENATVRLTDDGNLALHDAKGTRIWSTGISGSSAIGVNLTGAGNLVLFDGDNKTVWQSRDHPTNALFLGQQLPMRQKLRRGQFFATVLHDGLYAFVDSEPPQISCFRTSKEVPSGNGNSYINYTNTSLTLHTSDAGSFLLTNLVTAKSTFQYMSLEDNGHVKIFDWSSGWSITGDVFDQLGCLNPFECGQYEVYTNQTCTCPGSDSGKGSYFKYIDAGKPALGCSPLTRLDCGSMQDHQFLNLTEVAYFSYIDEAAAAFNGTDEQTCVQACLKNCSCRAALYKYNPGDSGGFCYLPSQLLSLQTNDPAASGYHSTAHIKVQKAPESYAPSPSPNAASALTAEPPKKRSNIGVILGSVLGGLSFLFLVSTLTVLLVRRRKQDLGREFWKEETLEEQEEHFEAIPGMPTRFTFEQLALATDNFAKKLGKGGFGSVFLGELGNENVAVKLLSGVNQGKKEFLAEVQTIGKTHHFNLVRLIGFCAERSHRMLVYEYMPNGSLDKWIFNQDQNTALSWQLRCKIIFDIAKGLSYLHEECPQRIAHLDIKPQNILLDDKFNAKVSDFGLAKLIERDQTHVMTMMRGTPGYLAPEWLTSFITEKVDVYSFGVMVLEIVCRRKNLDASQPPERTHLVRLLQDMIKMDRLLDLVGDDEIGTSVNQDEAIQMIKLATWCLNHDPGRRPSMSTVVKVLEGVVNVETNVESDFIASIPVMQSQSYDLLASSSHYASSASPQSASLLSGPR